MVNFSKKNLAPNPIRWTACIPPKKHRQNRRDTSNMGRPHIWVDLAYPVHRGVHPVQPQFEKRTIFEVSASPAFFCGTPPLTDDAATQYAANTGVLCAAKEVFFLAIR